MSRDKNPLRAKNPLANTMWINGSEWTYEVSALAVKVRDTYGETTSIARDQFHRFETISPQDVKRFILNGLKPVDYSNDKRRAGWQVNHGALVGKNTTEPDYPEHAKLKAVKDQSQAIGDFLEWLGNDRANGNIFLCERHPKNEVDSIWYPFGGKSEKLLAEYFDIDEKKLEAEKRAILDAQRKTNAMVAGTK